MRRCSVKVAVMDMGHQIAICADPGEERVAAGEKRFAFTVAPEVAERLIDDLRDALKQAAHRREKHRLDREAGVYGPYIAKIL